MAKRKSKKAQATRVFASVEVGNGMAVIYAIREGDPRVYVYSCPSLRATATGDQLVGGIDQMKLETVYWNNQVYGVGDDVIDFGLKAGERQIGVARYGDDLEEFFTAYLLVKSGAVQNGDVVDVSVFAPPGMFNEVYDQMTEAYAGTREIQIGDGDPVYFVYNNCVVLPEGYASALCFIFLLDGTPAFNDVLDGRVAFIDAGFHTLDKGHFVDGIINPEDLGNATVENGGVKNHILMPILKVLHAKYPDSKRFLTMNHIDKVIRHGSVTDDWRIFVGRQGTRSSDGMVSIKTLVVESRNTYADWIANVVIDSELDGLAGYKSAIVTGGGMYGVYDELQRQYEARTGVKYFVSPSKVTAKVGKSKVKFEDLNVAGGLIFLQAD